MSNNVTVGFSNGGQASHYVVDNATLASELGVVSGSILGSTYITENVSGGALSDPYLLPGTSLSDGGTVSADYTTVSSVDEAYRFISSGWNAVKNITVHAEGDSSILFIADNFVQADMDFSGVTNTVELRIFDGKRSNVWTGDGDDRIEITTATNGAGWSNLHIVHTGDGDDIVILKKGDLSLDGVTTVDGHYTTVEADLGAGNDIYTSTNDNLRTVDKVDGGFGNDTIFTGDGNDIITGSEDHGAVFQVSDHLYDLLAEGDRLFGGAGHDTFNYSNGDGFGIIGDGFDHIVDFSTDDIVVLDLLNPGTDTVETQIATLHTAGGDLTGTMILINGEASMFLENYTDTSDIFV